MTVSPDLWFGLGLLIVLFIAIMLIRIQLYVIANLLRQFRNRYLPPDDGE